MRSIAAITHVRPRMGTFLALSIAAGAAECQSQCVQMAFRLATRCERIMSRHHPDSDLSRLNRRAGLRSPALAAILRTARRLSGSLEGAFDPTIGPVVDLWRAASRRGCPPSRAALHRARAAVGAGLLHVSGERVRLARAEMVLDLGGLGKGVALDRIASFLARRRCAPGILNFGESSLIAVGASSPGWRVALRHPRGGFAGEFTLRDRACSTSAALGRPMSVGGRVVGDVIDPRSGRPLERLAQVTVLARTATVAEATSTALLILGRGAVERIAERMAVEVCWIDESGICTTPGFALTRSA